MPDAYADIRGLPLIAVLSSLGFTDWKSRKNDTEWFGKCPVHDAKKNNTSFSFDAEGKYNCFSCGAKGRGAIDIFMAVRKVGFQQAVDALKGFNIQAELTKQARKPEIRLLQVPVTENPVFRSTYEKFKVESVWLKERGLLPATLDRFGVFQYRNDKRKSVYNGSVMLKLARYSDGECVGYLSRNIGEVTPEKPKYVFPKGFHKGLELFGACQLKEKAPVRVLYLVESPFCVMKFHQQGLAAVSPFGFSVSEHQVALIAQLAKGVIYLPDKNKRDQCSAYIESLSRVVWTKAPALPDGVEDPESLSRSQIEALT